LIEILSFSVLGVFIFTVSVFAGWNEPTATPPGNNIPAPINASITTQQKAGELDIGATTGAISTVSNSFIPRGTASSYSFTTGAALNLYYGGSAVINGNSTDGSGPVKNIGNAIDTYDAVNLGFANAHYAPITSALPTGTSGQTLRNNGSAWVANSIIYNNGTNVGVGTTAPVYKLDVKGLTTTSGIRSDMGFDIYQVPDPAIPTCVVSSGGSVNTGVHKYGVSFVTATGETHTTYATEVTTTAGNNTVTLTIPVSTDPRVTGRKIYRSMAGINYPHGTYYLTTIANNVDTTYIDTAADSALSGVFGASYFMANTTSNNITINGNKAITLDSKGTYYGLLAGKSLTTGGEMFIGYQAGQNSTTGVQNTIIGNRAVGGGILTGGNNVVLGSDAAYSLTTAANNVAIGYASLYSATSGNSNTAVGYFSGRFLGDGASTNNSSNSVYLGYNTKALAATDSNETVIGYNTTGIGNNSVVLGNDSVTTTALKGNVGIGTTAPSNTLSFGSSQDQKIWIENTTNTVAGKALTLQAGGTVNTGAATFVGLSQTSRSWYVLAVAPNGDVYSAADSGDIYKQTGGTGNFIALNQVSGVWRGAAAARATACCDHTDQSKRGQPDQRILPAAST